MRIALALGPAVWHVGVGYGKGHLSGSHYLFVTVCHKPSGRERCESWTATSKASARRDAAEAARRLARELAGGSS